MRILSAIQTFFAAGFIFFGLVTLFGIGITGLLFLVPGACLAATAAITRKKSRAATAVALAADAALAYVAVRRLEALFTFETTGVKLHHTFGGLVNANFFDYLVPYVVLLLVSIGVLAVLMDWRALRNSPWF